MRVDTASPTEMCRYVFAGPAPGIRELSASIRTPGTFIKMCGPGDLLLAMAPAGWRLEPRGYLMTHAGAPEPAASVPAGYRIELSRQGPALAATIFSEDGTIAASGYAAQHGGAFVFDRIGTQPAHRRRGLGKALMSALGAMQISSSTTRVLVATEEGRALYSSIGWTVTSIYSTIVLPDQET
jgi:GNAT superfamily N-acetyltransferase